MTEHLAGHSRTHRSVGGWSWCVVLVAVAAALPTLAVRDAVEHAELLRHHGVRVTADVVDTQGKACDVVFVDRSHGTPKVERERLDAYFHVGRKLNVVYDPRNPATIALASDIGVVREYLYRAPLIAIGLAAACGAFVVFRRTSPRRRVRARVSSGADPRPGNGPQS